MLSVVLRSLGLVFEPLSLAMASFQLHEIENRLSHIESKELKPQENVSKQYRSILGQINQNIENLSKPDLPRKAKNVAVSTLIIQISSIIVVHLFELEKTGP